ncbi:hypothetical protein QA635_04175 [Bradyrhizobium brasilense]|uniref:hypothetical protein n=1 Tax=Bradyrhizobium brasilense TaxID=1419277 RepID=UPI0024B21C46|nr:hypothetical protein [Bradyrhizobium australafricanum]WFU33652.1 hypothetical protein QA635_04175 [Bradyrhizobium australafricanum]
MTAGNAATDLKTLRVGVISPNLAYSLDWFPDTEHGDAAWPLESVAKRVALLFDRIYLTHDLDVTCELVGGYAENAETATLRYLAEQRLLFTPKELGYDSGEAFIAAHTTGAAAALHRRLIRVGNPWGDEEPGDMKYIGQPDIGDFDAQNGWHPRSRVGWNDPKIKTRKMLYENLLMRRNVAMLRAAGCENVAIVGRQYENLPPAKRSHPVWCVVLKELPQLDIRAPWEDVLGFRQEERTQHLVRSLRRWVRKIVAENWSAAELEDEIKELVYQYERHMHASRISGTKEALEIVITGVAELAEDVVKLRLGKLAKLATAILNQRAARLREESTAPGRELALIPEAQRVFGTDEELDHISS